MSTGSRSTARTTVRRLFSALAVSIGLASSAGASNPPQSVSPEAAPPAWVAYAERVNTAVTAWLSADDEVALRLRSYINASRPSADQSSAPLALKLWVGAAGAITKVEFPPFAQESANSDLRGLLVGRAIGAPPPKGMLLPLRLTVQLDPAPAPSQPTAGMTDARPHNGQFRQS